MSFGYSSLGFGGGNGNLYDPGMMTFNGTDGYYIKTSVTTTGNLATMVARFNRASFTGNVFETIGTINGGTYARIQAIVISSNHATLTNRRGRVQIDAVNSAGTNICKLISTDAFLDGADHVIFASFNGTAGTAVFYVDGVNQDNVANPDRVAPTTGTLNSGASSVMLVGNGSSTFFEGQIGYFGYRDAYLTNPTDFYHPVNGLQIIDETGWTQWGAQPLFWHSQGLMSSNLGSAGAMTANGTITGPS